MTPKSEAYLIVSIFFVVLLLIFGGIFFYLYWAKKKGKIWETSGGDDVSVSSQRKILREENPKEFARNWRYLFVFTCAMALFVAALMIDIFFMLGYFRFC